MNTKECHTGEAYNWIANDEYLYLTAKKCKRPSHLRNIWNLFGPKRKLNKKYVDWTQLFQDLKEL